MLVVERCIANLAIIDISSDLQSSWTKRFFSGGSFTCDKKWKIDNDFPHSLRDNQCSTVAEQRARMRFLNY